MTRVKIFVAASLLVALVVAWKLLPVEAYLQQTISLVRSWGGWGLVAYFCLYTALVLVGFPNTPLNIAAGILFGLAAGFVVTMVAALTGSSLCFVISRYLARDWFSRMVSKWNGRWLLDAVDAGGFSVMLLARLNPFLPSSIKDYGFGVTGVTFAQYSLATVLGQAPIMLMYVYLGWSGAVTLGSSRPLDAWHYALVVCGLVLSVALAGVLTWYGRRKCPSPA